MHRLFLSIIGLVASCFACSQQPNPEALEQQVFETERQFAKTMADRDFEAFTSFLSEEAVFLSGKTPQRGKQQVAEKWKGYYEQPGAPFS